MPHRRSEPPRARRVGLLEWGEPLGIAGAADVVRAYLSRVNLETPDVRYARSADISIAYQVVGNGPVDVVLVPYIINLVWAWEHPIFVDFCRRLTSFARLILLDKRGTGLSDRPRELPTLETRMDDVRAVMDDVGSSAPPCSAPARRAGRCARCSPPPIPSGSAP